MTVVCSPHADVLHSSTSLHCLQLDDLDSLIKRVDSCTGMAKCQHVLSQLEYIFDSQVRVHELVHMQCIYVAWTSDRCVAYVHTYIRTYACEYRIHIGTLLFEGHWAITFSFKGHGKILLISAANTYTHVHTPCCKVS